jgi:hypothetical protein
VLNGVPALAGEGRTSLSVCLFGGPELHLVPSHLGWWTKQFRRSSFMRVDLSVCLPETTPLRTQSSLGQEMRSLASCILTQHEADIEGTNTNQT